MYRIPFKNVAKESGISVRTLYRVINNAPGVSDSTRRKAIRALNKSGYTNLHQNHRGTILINVKNDDVFRQPLAMELVQTLSSESSIAFVNSEQETNAFLEAVMNSSTIISLEIISPSIMRKLQYINPSCLVINILCGGGGNLAIDSNDFLGGKLAADHLFRNGHRHILIPVPSTHHPNHADRIMGFKAKMFENNPCARIETAEYIVGHDSPESFWKHYFANSQEYPTAVFCPLGGLADHFPYFAEKFASLSVPDDISIIGYNRAEERGEQTLFKLDAVVFDLKKIVDCCKYFSQNPPLSCIDGTIHIFVEPQLITNNSVCNLKNLATKQQQ
ncbi:MAG: LacI family DNA-binding transcriptional regulator [Victivallales bacterium]|nr:LacI family DNA-binding transcriptional regulator [Victivallales bacterium]